MFCKLLVPVVYFQITLRTRDLPMFYLVDSGIVVIHCLFSFHLLALTKIIGIKYVLVKKIKIYGLFSMRQQILFILCLYIHCFRIALANE